MKILLLILLLVLYAGCTTVEPLVHTAEDGKIIMQSTADGLFSGPEEKLKLVFTPANGGQIDTIYWQGQKIASDFLDTYPGTEEDITKLEPTISEDGLSLITVRSSVKDRFQLRKSYNLRYNDKTSEHEVEVIYNVKNYSSDVAMQQQWTHFIKLAPSLNLSFSANSLKATDGTTEFRLEPSGVRNLTLSRDNGIVQIGNGSSFSLNARGRLQWKVVYVIKDLD